MKKTAVCLRWSFFQTLEIIGGHFPNIGKLAGGILVCAAALAAGAQTDDAKVSNAVHAVRLELEATLGKPVPSLSLVLQTPANTFFVSAAATPAQALASNTVFRFASNTKNFTATAVLHLHQQGLLHITNHIVDFIPGTDQPLIPAGTNWAIPHKNAITIQQLLRHSAGVYDVDNDPVPGCGGESYTGYMLKLDPAHPFTAEELAGQAARHQLAYFAPDAGYHYSNTGYTLLAEIVARVYSHYCGTNKTLSDYLYEQVVGGAAPVPLPDLHFPNLAADTALPAPYVPGTLYYPSNVTEVISNMNMSAQVGEGNGYGSLASLNRHVRAVMKGQSVLSNEAVHLMQTATSPANGDYALGCFFKPDIGFGHNGSRVGNLSVMAYNPETDVSVAVALPVVDWSQGLAEFMACFNAMYEAAYRALAALGYNRTPALQAGADTNLNLAAGATNVFYFLAAKDVFYGLVISNAVADIRLACAPAVNPAAATTCTNRLGWICPVPGTYRLSLSATSATPASIRFYSYTNTIAFMTGYITNQMAAQNVAGLSIALVDGDEIAWSQGFGLAVVESNAAATAATVYRIGSVSKIFTAAATLKLWEDGRLDLEAAITNYLPEFSVRPRAGGERPPTVRECLNHQSGLPGDMFRDGFSTAAWGGYNAWLAAELATDYPNYPAGFRSVYCNTGFQLAEEIVGRVSGSSLNDFAQSNFFGPLGMASSSFLKDKPNIAARRAHAYAAGTPFPEEFVNIRGTGGMYSSVEDMAALIRMILAEGRFGGTNILAAHTVAAMLTDQTTNIAMDVDSDFRVGLGWDSLADTKLNYAGRNCYKDGQTFTYYCSVIILNDRQLGVVVMNNTPGSLPNPVAHAALMQALAERDGLYQPTNYTPSVSAATNWPAETMAAVTGLYVTAEGMDSGYDLLDAAPDGTLIWTLKAHTEAPVVATGLTPHVDGWIYATAQPYLRIQPTNLSGHAVMIYRTAEEFGEIQSFRGDRYAPPPISAAWSNRLNVAWLPVDMPPTDLYWSYAQFGTDLRLRLTNRLGLIWLTSPSGHFVIAPSNDALGFAAGSAVRRGASVVITVANGVEDLRFSSYTYRRTDATPILAPGTATNAQVAAGATDWYRIYVTSGTTYRIELTTGDPLTVRRFDDGWTLLDQARAGQPLQFVAEHDGFYYLAVARTDPAAASQYLLQFSQPPLLIRAVAETNQNLTLEWQGVSNTTYAIETASDLVEPNAFVSYRTHVPSAGEITACTNPIAPGPELFYRVVDEQAAATNPVGRVVVFSDLHLSPFCSYAIVTNLAAAPVTAWDAILAQDTNGYCSVDATGMSTANPLLWQSALANGQAACPSPDAILILGDFEYYHFKNYYQQITGDMSEAGRRQFLMKMYEYILMKTAAAFPHTPIYPCLGNNDTFTNDFGISVGEDFLAATAPLFHHYGLTGVVSHTDFTATYTNGGNYAAPFGRGTIVALESVFMSPRSPCDDGPGSNQLAYLSGQLAACEAAGRPAWILGHIPSGVRAGDTWSRWQTGDVNYVETNWRVDFQDQFNNLIAMYPGTVGGMLCGHYHLRTLQLANDPATSNATMAIQIMGGLLNNHGDNPAFTVLTYERATLRILRETTYALPTPQYAGKTGPAVWDLLFSMDRGYNLPDLSAASLLTAWSNMAAVGSAAYDYFCAEYTTGQTPYTPNATNWPVYRGEIRWINPEQFKANVPVP